MPFWSRRQEIQDKLDFRFEKIKNLVNLDVRQPSIQRSVLQERVQHLTEQFNHKFIPVVPLYFCIFKNTYYIIDGQHRFEVFKTMSDIWNYKVPCVFVKVEKYEDVEECFFVINDRLPLNEMWLQPVEIKQIIMETYDYFEKNYPDMFALKKKGTVKRPNIDKELFRTTLSKIFEEEKTLDIRSSDELIKRMLRLDEEYATLDPDSFPSKGKNNNASVVHNLRKRDYPLHFGMVPNEWHIHLIHGIPKDLGNNVDRLSRAQQLQCWENTYGSCTRAKCYVCGIHEITLFNCHGGHIIARARGGKTVIKNIIPICQTCNQEMATENLEDFKKKHYT